MHEILNRLEDLFSPTRIAHYLVDDLLPDLVIAGITMLVAWLMWKLLARTVQAVLGRSELDETAQSFIQTLLQYLVFAIGLVTALGQLGVDTASLLTSLGVVGLTIGFAARDTLANVISGLFIFWDRPFVINDLVEIDGQYGRVQKITMRSTRVVTSDGRMLAIPNSQIVNTVVASYTNFPNLRLDIAFTIGVEEDIPKAREIARQVVVDDPRYLGDPAPVVVVTALNDYNVSMELRAWLEDEREHVPSRLELRERLFEALRAAQIEMPFETLAVVETRADAG
ncbi:mechanosensitive ion channel family protein [Pseudenhygromyxa sp. WMMC2535]|uniref:mechanosensitive ion channel family protein n=1 Tax=Pseudenhygromyxa sp. WMMC2535 TaxID=2712867 RepID=UPI001553D829|nr:mechanosensitive ion channel family protein [Pseudenhygromyxa sp. WMMC2535]NVB38738.1 mechanosensitive ion channel family protein [Pseudenhygromyxa sp. WMMC2535]